MRQQRLFSRSGREFALRHVTAALCQLDARSPEGLRYLDGELCHPDGRYAIQAALNCADERLRFHAFDAVLEDEPFSQRHARLQALLGQDVVDAVQLVNCRPLQECDGAEALLGLLQTNAQLLARDGYEGVVLRCDENPLHADRAGYEVTGRQLGCAIKYKPRDVHEFPILVCQEAKGVGGCGQLGSVRLHRLGSGRTQKHFTVQVGNSWSEKRRQDEWSDRQE